MAVEVLDYTVVANLTSDTVVGTKPANTVEGNLLLAQHVCPNGATFTAPDASWQRADFDTIGVLWWKIAGAAEPADYTFRTSQPLGANRLVIARCTGHHPSQPIAAADLVQYQTAANTHDSPSVNATTDGSLLVSLLTTAQGNPGATPPAGMFEEFDDPAGGVTHAAASLGVNAGATGVKTWTLGAGSAQTAVVTSLVINPAAAASANPGSIRAVFRTARTFTVPPGVTSITVECIGPGGPGGGGSTTNRGGGGGGGAWARSVLSVVPGTVYDLNPGLADAPGGAAPVPSTFGPSGAPLVRGAAGSPGATTTGLNNGAGGAGGTVANSIGTDRTAGATGANGGSGGAGASGGSIIGGAGGSTGANINGLEPGGGGGGGAALSGVGGTSGRGQVVVTYSLADVAGEGRASRGPFVNTMARSAAGEGLASHNKAAAMARSAVGEGQASRVLAVAIPRSAVGEGLSSYARLVNAVRNINVVGEGLASRGALQAVMSRSAAGEGLASSAKFTTAFRTFTVAGEGLVTETHPVQAFRTFNVAGDGLVSRGGLVIARAFSVVGEGLASGTKAVVAVRTFSIAGEGLASRVVAVELERTVPGEGVVTEIHPVQAFRTFDVGGRGHLLMSGPNGSTITVPLDELPNPEGGGSETVIRPVFIFDD